MEQIGPQENAQVSVVIPTRGRARMALAAVQSALAQTVAPLEVIVVIDGPEGSDVPSTLEVLSEVQDARLSVLALSTSVGGGEARNLGVRAARGEWIAFLDDDDLWLPEKLATQMRFARGLAAGREPVLSCPVLARAPGWQEVWPRVRYRAGASMAEYLFCRRGWRYGEALLQTSTLVARRRLLMRVPFAAGLPKHQDWDWLLRATAEPDVAVHPVGSEPLVLFHVEGDRRTVSRTRNWRASFAWAEARRKYFSRRALAGFVATECAAQAQGGPWRERRAVFCALLRCGLPRPGDLVKAAVFLLLPQAARRSLRDLLRPLALRSGMGAGQAFSLHR